MDKELVRKIKGEGHLLGNFTFHGQAQAETLPLAKFMAEAVAAQTALTDLTGSAPQYMRAPRTKVTADLLVRTAAAGLPVYVDTPLLFYPSQMATKDNVKTFALGVGGGASLPWKAAFPSRADLKAQGPNREKWAHRAPAHSQGPSRKSGFGRGQFSGKSRGLD